VELPNSFEIVIVDLDEIPSTLSVDCAVPRLLVVKMNPIHVIFDINGILITTCFDKGSRTMILRFGLKEFLENVLLNSKSIFGLQSNITIFIIIWITSNIK
jgi:hypothetical protein